MEFVGARAASGDLRHLVALVLTSVLVLVSCATSDTAAEPSEGTALPSPTSIAAEPTASTGATEAAEAAEANEANEAIEAAETMTSVQIQVGDARWSMTLQGIHDAGPGLNDPASRCYTAYGVLTALAVPGGLPSEQPDLPWLFAETPDQSVEAGFARCDRDLVIDRGWLWFRDIELTEGSVQPFHAHFLVPEGEPVSALRIHDQVAVDRLIPWPAATEDVPLAPSPFEADPVRSDPLSEFPIEPFGADWSVLSMELVAREAAEGGQCHLLFGIVQAQTAPGIVTEGQPRFSLLTDQGRASRPALTDCQFEDALGRGYLFPYNAEVRQGAQYPFFMPFVVPTGATIEAVLTELGDDTPITQVKPRFADELGNPRDELRAAAPIQGSPPLTSGKIFVADAIDSWEITVAGSMIAEGRGRGELEGRCLVVFGTMTPVASQNPDSLTNFRPHLKVLANGIAHWWESGSCNTSEARSLGYDFRPDHVVGEQRLFFDYAFVPTEYEIEGAYFVEPPLYSVSPLDTVTPP